MYSVKRHVCYANKLVKVTTSTFWARVDTYQNILNDEQVFAIDNTYMLPSEDVDPSLPPTAPWVQSPYIDRFYHHYPARIIIDSCATGNMIRLSAVKRLEAYIHKSLQSAHQADGSSPLKVIGEMQLIFLRDNQEFLFEGLIVEHHDVNILAGAPFVESINVVTSSWAMGPHVHMDQQTNRQSIMPSAAHSYYISPLQQCGPRNF